MTKLIEGSNILFDTIKNNRRHIDYPRVLQVAKDFTIYATGIGISEKLRRFNSRETVAEHTQRLSLTIPNVQDIFNSCVKPLYKVGRTPANISFTWTGSDVSKSVEKRNKLLEAGKNFWGKKDVSNYITQRQADLDSTDPNSFVIVEFAETVDPADETTKAKPYPFEANSEEAINYKYKNQELQWLVVLNECIMLDDKDVEVKAEKYYMYIDNETITATQIHPYKVPIISILQNLEQINSETILLPKDKRQYLYQTDEEDSEKRRYYIIEVYEHKIGFVPAIRFGTILDPLTRNRTCIPLIFAAQAYFEKSIKAMSEFDLSNCLHMFPQKIVYSDPCPGEPMEGGMYIGCQNGMRPDGKTICGACKGSGFKGHTSAADVIQIKMPKDLKDMISLEGLIAYKTPPIELLEFQKKFGFYELRQLAQGSVYNSDVFTRDEIAQTATGKMIDLDAVYDTLTPFADSWSEMYEHIYRCIAAVRDLGKGLVVDHQFPSDFKMESFDMLLNYLQKASVNGAPSYIKKAINKKITHKIYIDEQREVLKIETKDKYFPFSGKTENEINYILSNSLTTEYNKIFYANFDLIFAELEYEAAQKNLDFYNIDETAQRTLIKNKVNAFIVDIDTEDAAAAATGFNGVAPATEEVIPEVRTEDPSAD